MAPDELQNDPGLERLLARLDHPIPDVTPADVVRRARRYRGRRLARAAAVILGLAVASGAAYAAPGSPLPGWIAEAGRRLGLHTSPSDPPPSDIPIAGPDSAGIDVSPELDLTIRFLEDDLDGVLHVTRTDDDRVGVRTSSSATSFSSEPDRLLVRHASPDTVRITIPRTAPRVEIQVGARRILLQEGLRLIVAPGVEIDRDGAYIVPLRSAGG